jgi:ubiquinone/menaquinone biosynthesis C-methylase UbiE
MQSPQPEQAMPPQVCPWWKIHTFDNPLRRLIQKPERILKGLITEGDTVLDIGCGYGYFSLAMARMVGDAGLVIAADVQQRMLDGLRRRAEKHGLQQRIRLHLCRPNDLELAVPVDFVLAFWMAHEAPDQEAFLRQVGILLKAGARLLIAEPLMHVSRRQFEGMNAIAERAGLKPLGKVKVSLSRAALFGRR